MQEKESIMVLRSVRCQLKIPSLVMLNSYPRDGIFNQHLTIIKDSYKQQFNIILLMSCANNKGADQPAHPRSLISTLVVCCLDSIISLEILLHTFYARLYI